jgi:hypothetical protein
MLPKTFVVATTIALSSGFAADAVAQNGGVSGNLGYVGADSQVGEFGPPGAVRVSGGYLYYNPHYNHYRGHAGFDNGPQSCLINDADNRRACSY